MFLLILALLSAQGGPQPVAEIALSDAPSNPWSADYAGPIVLKVNQLFSSCPSGEMTTPVILTVDQEVQGMRVRVTQPEIQLKGGKSKGLFAVQSPSGDYYCSEISNDESLVLNGPAGEWLIFVGHNGQPNMGIERPFTLEIEDPNKDLDPDLDGSEAPHYALSAGQGVVRTGYHGSYTEQPKLSPVRKDGRVCSGKLPDAPAFYLELEEAQSLDFSGDMGPLALVGPIEGPWREIQSHCVKSKAADVAAGTWAVFPADTYGSKGIYTVSVSSGEVDWKAWEKAFEPTADTKLDERWLWRVFPQAGLKASTMDITRAYELIRAAPLNSFVYVSEAATLEGLRPASVDEGGELPAVGEAMLMVMDPYVLGLDGSWYILRDQAALDTAPPAVFVMPTARNMPSDFQRLRSLGLHSPSVDAFLAADTKDAECRSVSSTRHANATEGQVLTQAQAAAASDRLAADNGKCAVHAKAAKAAKEKAVSEMQGEWSKQIKAQHDTSVLEIKARMAQ